MYTLVLIRHGQSQWNLENRFTGWADVPLTELGLQEATAAGELLRQEGYSFDVAFTSLQKRAIKTLWTVLEKMDLMWIPVHRSWRLNERHYGALQGLNKAETAAAHGDEQVKTWRRSYDVPPPALAEDDPRHPHHDPRFASIPEAAAISTESLKTTQQRALPFWEEAVAPAIRAGQKVIVAAHGNSLRALVQYLDGLSNDEVCDLNIPTGIPLVYQLDADLKPLQHFYLGDQAAIAAAAAAVAKQAQAKA